MLLVPHAPQLCTGIPLSHGHPPKNQEETITVGTLTAMRSSRRVARNVWVPPPEAPVMAMREASVSGRERRKSTTRMEFQVCMVCAMPVRWSSKAN